MEWVLSFVAVVVAIILHEIAHGYAALALGDDTAKRMGRLSLNPLVHVDRVGTIIVPGLFLIAQALARTGGGVFFGWAKPVPIDIRRLPNPRRSMALVALAGPLMNYALAFLALLLLHATPLLPWEPRLWAIGFLAFFLMANLALGTFNLLPIPPLDGGRIAVGVLPERLAIAWAGMERAGIAVVLLVVFLLPAALAEFGIGFDPLRWWLHGIADPIFRFLAALAGHPRDLVIVLRFLDGDGGG
ncbi:site-2 protease family protein [Rhodovastum atsumiense]|uniref:Site-2 protease family protein n=1 Tax=Rhodovastum atsumiense TaxID=504468 RepID=A0A5M6IM39_9PROT|nr:site-2 protease family protein [Rhodovastum atsumiense]KAA5609311.1 site-2 protease family protein [Rhodovastum atsumiense]